MIQLAVARRLRDLGLVWTPASGDRFVVVDRDMDTEVFVLSEMTIEVHNFPQGPVIGFNGTTEWALDSVDHDNAVWLPSETQLRERLGATFRRLSRGEQGWRVDIEVNGHPYRAEDASAEQAYGLALVHLIEAAQ
jgi:hypothetical protein